MLHRVNRKRTYSAVRLAIPVVLGWNIVFGPVPAAAQNAVTEADVSSESDSVHVAAVPDSAYVLQSVDRPAAPGPASGLYFGLKSAAASYVGTPDSEEALSLGPSLTGEIAYQMSRHLALGISYQHASGTEAETSDASRQMGHLSVRAGLPADRLSPYVRLGVHRIFGETEENYGADAALGVDLRLSQRISVFPELAFHMTDPLVEASAKSLGGIGSFGIGMRLNLVRRYHPPEIRTVVGPATIRVGETARFEAVHVEGASQPVTYEWRVAGQLLRGNPVEYDFKRPGRFEVTVESSNRAGTRSALLYVDVLHDTPLTAGTEYMPAPGSRPFRIVTIYGPETIRVGELVNFRVRAAEGAARPTVYRWAMGDGALADGNNVSHIYQRPGRYQVIATARNREGSDADTLSVTVIESPVQPALAARNRGAEQAEAPPNPAVDSTAAVTTPVSARERPLRGYEPIDWSKPGFTLLAVTATSRYAAETAAVEYRRKGYRSGIYVDDSGPGSAVFRVIVGQFESEAEAAAARQRILRAGLEGTFLVQQLPTR